MIKYFVFLTFLVAKTSVFRLQPFVFPGNVTSNEERKKMKLEMKMIKVFSDEERKNHFNPIICEMLNNLSIDEKDNETMIKEVTDALNGLKIVTNNLISAVKKIDGKKIFRPQFAMIIY